MDGERRGLLVVDWVVGYLQPYIRVNLYLLLML